MSVKPIATAEEVARVMDFWSAVRAVVEGRSRTQPESPGQDVLNRVARHQRRQSDLLCEHEEVTIMFGQDPTCARCERPVQVLSDVQVEELKEGATDERED